MRSMATRWGCLRHVGLVVLASMFVLAVPRAGHADVLGTLLGAQECDTNTHEVVATFTLTNLSGVDLLIDGYVFDDTGLTAGSVVDSNPQFDVEILPAGGTSTGHVRFTADVAGTYSLSLFVVPAGSGSSQVDGSVQLVPDTVWCPVVTTTTSTTPPTTSPETTTSSSTSTSSSVVAVSSSVATTTTTTVDVASTDLGAAAGLPHTGTTTAPTVLFATGLVVCGGLLLVARRRVPPTASGAAIGDSSTPGR